MTNLHQSRLERLPSQFLPKLFKEGRHIRGRYCKLIYKQQPVTQGVEAVVLVQVVVSSKMVKKAVDRNRIKRRWREVLRRVISQEKSRVGELQAIVSAYPQSKDVEFEELVRDFSWVWGKILTNKNFRES